MKYIRDYDSRGDATALKDKLRKKGVLAVIEKSRAVPPRPSAWKEPRRFRTGVWIVIDSQYEDAMSLRKGNSHVVENPLTEDEMLRLELEVKAVVAERSTNIMNIVVTILCLGLIVTFVYRVFLSV